MKLRTRFALGFAGVGLVAAGGLFATAYYVVDRAWEERAALQNEVDLERLNLAHERTAAMMDDKAQLVVEMLRREDNLPILQDAAAGAGIAKGWLAEIAAKIARERKLDVVDVIQAHGSDATVIASAHFRQGFDRSDPSTLERAGGESAGLVFLQAGIGTSMRLAWTDTRRVLGEPGDPRGIYVVTGIFLDDRQRLADFAGPESCLEIPGRGALHALATRTRDPFDPQLVDAQETCGGPDDFDFFQLTQLPILPSFDGVEGRSAVLSVGRPDPRREAIRNLRLAFVAISAALVLLSLPVAAFFARRFSEPIASLADGARALAAGDLSHRVEPIAGGRGDELVALVKAFNQMASDIEDSRAKLVQSERIAAWREIARRIAHEIKNPLTPIQLAVETTRKAHKTKRADFDEIFEESAQAILEEVESLKKLVKEFSEFARMPEPTLAPTDLNETLRSTIRVFTGLPDGITIDTRLDESLPKMMLDRGQLSRAFLNLIANAADAIGSVRGSGGVSPPGTITITTRRVTDSRGDFVEIHVIDTGPGIPPGDREKIFAPYFTTKTSGTGLGLSIVQRILSDHGGEIRAGAGPGGGADFVVRLPLSAALPAAALG